MPFANKFIYKKNIKTGMSVGEKAFNKRNNSFRHIKKYSPIPKIKLTNKNQNQPDILYDHLLNTIPDVIWEFDFVTQSFRYISPSIFKLRGYTLEEAMKERIEDTLHEDDFQFIMSNLDSRIKHFESGDGQMRITTNELRQTHKNGSYVWVEITTKLLTNRHGKVTGILGVSRDISQRKQEQELLKDTQNFFETVFDFTGTGIALIQENGSIINVNSGFCKMIGYPKYYVLQKSFFDFLVDGDDSCVQDVFDAARSEKSLEKQAEIRLINLHGQIIWGLLNVSGVKPENSSTMLWVIQIQETTGRKRSEEIIKMLNLDLQQKNREMEHLIYITSHDLRSPLVNIRGFNKELQNSFNEIKETLNLKDPEILNLERIKEIETEIRESFDYIGISIEKMDRLLGGLLKYSRLGKRTSPPALLSMNNLIADVIKTHEYTIKNNPVIIETNDLPDSYASEEMLNQAFSNLVENAIKYLDKSRMGHIKISGWLDDKYSVYCMEDNGIGIREQHQKKIFELFYRLNSQDEEGEGLGLSTVKKIIELNGGKIKLESKYGEGSKFIIYLPREPQHTNYLIDY
jgi:PAS domain S-box-containing protein